MKLKALPFALLCLFTLKISAQAGDDYQGRLYRLCKVWGYVKYHHSAVSNCEVNWDSVLVATIPNVKAATDSVQFNNAVLQMLTAAGPMAVGVGPAPVLDPTLAINVDSTWMGDTYFSAPVRLFLDSIRHNFRPHDICYVRNNDYTDQNYTGWLVFAGDTIYKVTSTYPNEPERLLMLFRHWNIMNYFNPNSRALDAPWNVTLLNNVLPIANATSALNLYKAFLRVFAKLNDAHVQGLSYSNSLAYPGFFMPQFTMQYVQGEYVVDVSNISGLHRGDIIDSIDNMSTRVWDDTLRNYISSGNDAVFHRDAAMYMLSGNYGTTAKIYYRDSSGASRMKTNGRTYFMYGDWYYLSISNHDSVTTYKTIGCDIGYVHMGNLTSAQVPDMYNTLKDKAAIIFDIRNYPQGTAWDIAPLMFAQNQNFAKLLTPDVQYPGNFTLESDFIGSSNPTPYTGKVILLMNEQTQSQAEYTCMMLEKNANVLKMGSQTAGADGNVSWYSLSSDLTAGFSTLGVYYPDGTLAQRTGIVPNVVVKPTIAGFRNNVDEVLDSAIALACSTSGIKQLSTEMDVRLYPNPANSTLNIITGSGNTLSMKITDLQGNVLRQAEIVESAEIDVRALAEGLYLINLFDSSKGVTRTLKFVKQ